MNQYASNSRALAPLPDYSGTAIFFAITAAVSGLAYLLIADWISSNLALNLSLIAISCALIGYCGLTTWTMYRASELIDTLDGTVELGRPTRAELLQLIVDAQKVRRILDVKALRSIIQSIQSRGDFALSADTMVQMRSRAEKASRSSERSTDAGMLIVPLLAMSMGAWSFITDSAAGRELNAAIMSPLMVGFLSASLLVLLNKQSQHSNKLFCSHLQQWLTLRSAPHNEQNEELAQLRDTIELLERKVKLNKGLTQQLMARINSLLENQTHSLDIAAPVQIQSQKIISQATGTGRVFQSTRKEDIQSGELFPQHASNDEHPDSHDEQSANISLHRSAAA